MWTKPDLDVELHRPTALFVATRTARLTFIVINEDWSPGIDVGVFDVAMAALPLDSLVMLTAQNNTNLLDKQDWLRHAPRWPLLRHVHLASLAAHGFREMLLENSRGHESPLLPSLTNLTLVKSALSARRTLCLCDALMKHVEQGVPLEMLDLHMCLATSRAVQLLGEVVVDVRSPVKTLATEAQRFSTWNSGARGFFTHDSDSGVEDCDKDNSDTDDDDEEWEDWGMDYNKDENDEEVEDYWEMEDD